jgi:glycosyltransferase involved in cell wall biosynthesis
MATDLPPISCICITYGRPTRLLEEAVQSFLLQDYAGEKELLILNDFDQQIFYCDHPEVTVVNLPVRFHTVGEKQNAAVALCRYDLLAVWDDDDVSLPHRLSYSVRHYDGEKRFFKAPFAFRVDDGVVQQLMEGPFHVTSMWHRSLFDEAGGYPHMGSGYDQELEARFQTIISVPRNFTDIAADDVYYLYRWGGTGSYHTSGLPPDHEGLSEHERIERLVLESVSNGSIESGQIRLEPHWDLDYPALVRAYLSTDSP